MYDAIIVGARSNENPSRVMAAAKDGEFHR